MNDLEQLLITEDRAIKEQDLNKKIRGILSVQALKQQNHEFAGTPGVSQNNRSAGFIPAYCDTTTGQSVVSRFADGRLAPIHILDGLPEEWVTMRDLTGRVSRIRSGVVAGFLCDGRFFTREEAVRALSH